MPGNKTQNFQQNTDGLSKTNTGIVSSVFTEQEFECPISQVRIGRDTLPVYFYSQINFAAEKIKQILSGSSDLSEDAKETLSKFNLEKIKRMNSTDKDEKEILENLSSCMQILRERPEFANSSLLRVYDETSAINFYNKNYSEGEDKDPLNCPLSGIKTLFRDSQIARIIGCNKIYFLDALLSDQPIKNIREIVVKFSKNDIQFLLNSDQTILKKLVNIIMQEKDLDFLKFLVENGFPLNARINENKQTLLHWAVDEDNVPFLEYLSKIKYLDIDAFLNAAPVGKIILATRNHEVEISESQFEEPVLYVFKINGDQRNRSIEFIWKTNDNQVNYRFTPQAHIEGLGLPMFPALDKKGIIIIDTEEEEKFLQDLKQRIFEYDLFYSCSASSETPLAYAIRLNRKHAVEILLSDRSKNVFPSEFYKAIDSNNAEVFQMLINQPNNVLTKPFQSLINLTGEHVTGEPLFIKLFKRAEEKKSYNILLSMYAEFPEWISQNAKKMPKKTLLDSIKQCQVGDTQVANMLLDIFAKNSRLFDLCMSDAKVQNTLCNIIVSESNPGNLQQIFDSLITENSAETMVKLKCIIALINKKINSENAISTFSEEYNSVLKNIYDVLSTRNNVNEVPVLREFLLKYDGKWEYSIFSAASRFFFPGWWDSRPRLVQPETKHQRTNEADGDVTLERRNVDKQPLEGGMLGMKF